MMTDAPRSRAAHSPALKQRNEHTSAEAHFGESYASYDVSTYPKRPPTRAFRRTPVAVPYIGRKTDLVHGREESYELRRTTESSTTTGEYCA